MLQSLDQGCFKYMQPQWMWIGSYQFTWDIHHYLVFTSFSKHNLGPFLGIIINWGFYWVVVEISRFETQKRPNTAWMVHSNGQPVMLLRNTLTILLNLLQPVYCGVCSNDTFAGEECTVYHDMATSLPYSCMTNDQSAYTWPQKYQCT